MKEGSGTVSASATGWGRVALAVAARPWLWPVAAAQVFRLARRGWWRRPPFLPLPDPEYLRFRIQTAYGGSAPELDRVEVDDVLTYLRWCRRFPD